MKTILSGVPETYNFRFLTGAHFQLPKREMIQMGGPKQWELERPVATNSSIRFYGSTLEVSAGFWDFPHHLGLNLKLLPVLVFESWHGSSILRLGVIDIKTDSPRPEVQSKLSIRRTYFFDHLSQSEIYRVRDLKEIQLLLVEPTGFGHFNDIWLADYHKIRGNWV